MTKPNIYNVQIFRLKMTSNGRLPKMAKFEYLSNYWSDLIQILNLDLYDQAKLSQCPDTLSEDGLKWKMT